MKTTNNDTDDDNDDDEEVDTKNCKWEGKGNEQKCSHYLLCLMEVVRLCAINKQKIGQLQPRQ